MFPDAVLSLPPLRRWVWSLLQQHPDHSGADLAFLTGSDPAEISRCLSDLTGVAAADGATLFGVGGSTARRRAEVLSTTGERAWAAQRGAAWVLGVGAPPDDADGWAEGGLWQPREGFTSRRQAREAARRLARRGAAARVCLSPAGEVRWAVNRVGWTVVCTVQPDGRATMHRQGSAAEIRRRHPAAGHTERMTHPEGGVTLVEVLVVVTVIAALIAAVSVVHTNSQTAARERTAVQHRAACEAALAAQRDPMTRMYPPAAACAHVGVRAPAFVTEVLTMNAARTAYTLQVSVNGRAL